MTYLELYNNIKQIVDNKGFNFNVGDVYSINFKSNVKYPIVNMFVENINVDGMNNNYNIVMYYIDRLTTNKSNEINIQSDSIIYLTEIMNNIEPADVNNITLTPFSEDFGDNCSGCFARFTTTVRNNIGTCTEY